MHVSLGVWVSYCVFNVFNLTTLFNVAELVRAKKNFRLIVMIATDNKVF